MKNTLKRLMLVTVGVGILYTNNVRAAENEGQDSLRHSPLTNLASELIVNIGDSLYDKDFSSFALSCNYCFNALNNPSKFFLPEKQEELLDELQNTSFDGLSFLALKGSRIKKQKLVSSLEKISQNFSDHKYSIPMSLPDYDKKMANFIMYLKCKFMSFLLGDEKSKEDIIKIKKSKINAYYQDDPELDNTPGAVSLKITQGVFVSQDLLNTVKKWVPSALQEEIKRRSLDQQMKFLPVTEFFVKF